MYRCLLAELESLDSSSHRVRFHKHDRDASPNEHSNLVQDDLHSSYSVSERKASLRKPPRSESKGRRSSDSRRENNEEERGRGRSSERREGSRGREERESRERRGDDKAPMDIAPDDDGVSYRQPTKIATAKGPAKTVERMRKKTNSWEDIAYDEAFKEMQRLTIDQREIVKKTFPIVETDAIRNALQILLRLFSEHPRYKDIWPQFRAIPDSSLMSAVELRRHASVYMAGLRTIIDSMDDEILLAEHLKRIARAHIKWNVHKAHVMHMLVPVLEVLSHCLHQYPLQADVKEAWTTLYDVIANLIDIFREHERRASFTRPQAY